LFVADARCGCAQCGDGLRPLLVGCGDGERVGERGASASAVKSARVVVRDIMISRRSRG
jgi:hypothetical protein